MMAACAELERDVYKGLRDGFGQHGSKRRSKRRLKWEENASGCDARTDKTITSRCGLARQSATENDRASDSQSTSE